MKIQIGIKLKKDIRKNLYSLQPILPFTNMDVFRHILVLDTFVFAKGNIGWRE
jgi:hypothetical protein